MTLHVEFHDTDLRAIGTQERAKAFDHDLVSLTSATRMVSCMRPAMLESKRLARSSLAAPTAPVHDTFCHVR